MLFFGLCTKFRINKPRLGLTIYNNLCAWHLLNLTEAKVHDVNILGKLIPEPGSIYVMDRAYLDFERLYSMHQSLAYFVIRKKINTRFVRLYSNKVNKSTGLRCDQVIRLSGFYAKKAYPEKLRRVEFFDVETSKSLNFFTNQFTWCFLSII